MEKQYPNFNIIQKDGIIIAQPKAKHVNTLIFIHGLAENPNTHFQTFVNHLAKILKYYRIVLPRAPQRYVTVMKQQTTSWFDIKFRSQKSFIVDFDEAFNSKQVQDSYQNYLKPIIQQEYKLLKSKQQHGKLIVGGFSQGCGMSLHCLSNSSDKVYAAVGVAGYLFPITKMNQDLAKRVKVIYGAIDQLRPWEYVKATYQGRIQMNRITIVQGMAHNTTQGTRKQLTSFFEKQIDIMPSL